MEGKYLASASCKSCDPSLRDTFFILSEPCFGAGSPCLPRLSLRGLDQSAACEGLGLRSLRFERSLAVVGTLVAKDSSVLTGTLVRRLAKVDVHRHDVLPSGPSSAGVVSLGELPFDQVQACLPSIGVVVGKSKDFFSRVAEKAKAASTKYKRRKRRPEDRSCRPIFSVSFAVASTLRSVSQNKTGVNLNNPDAARVSGIYTVVSLPVAARQSRPSRSLASAASPETLPIKHGKRRKFVFLRRTIR